jgi:hypothetical protein
MSDMPELLTRWAGATGELKYGVQRVFHDVFVLAAEGKTHLIYGADYYQGMPCLVNTVGGMLTTGGGEGIPSAHFGQVVGLFDDINREFERLGINTEPNRVSEVAAETLLRNFAELKPLPPEPGIVDAKMSGPILPETSDEEMAEAMVSLFTSEPLEGEVIPQIIAYVEDEFAVGRVHATSNNND